MSTRANIIIEDKSDKLYFYRHSDGYPETTMESLKEFVNMYKDQLRDNVSQSAGFLILKGAIEYGFTGDITKPNEEKYSFMEWKVGAYEPTTGVHEDIEYLYTIDLVNKELKCYEAKYKIKEGESWGDADEELTLKSEPILTYSFVSEEDKKLVREISIKSE